MNKDFEDYKKSEEIIKKYASQLKEEIEEYIPREFYSEKDIECSIECILDEMYEEIKSKTGAGK